MKIVYPASYKEFSCSKDQCKRSCCSDGWDIELDEKTLSYFENKYKDKKLSSSLRKVDDSFYYKNKKGCCVWFEDGLCSIYMKYGSDFQSLVCKQFPRFNQNFGDVEERGLGFACEEAAKLIFTMEAPFELKEELEEKEASCQEVDCYEQAFKKFIFEVRNLLLSIAGDKNFSIYARLRTIVNICEDIQEEINEKDLINNQFNYLLEEIRHKYMHIKEDDRQVVDLNKVSRRLWEKIDFFFEYFLDLPDVRRDYEILLESMEKSIERAKKKTDIFSKLDKWLEKSDRKDDYGHFVEYLIFRYFSRAIYDRDIALKGRMLVGLFFFLRLMDLDAFIKSSSKLSLNKRIDIVETFSREIEYSEDNMEQLFEGFLFDDIFKRESLINMLKDMEVG